MALESYKTTVKQGFKLYSCIKKRQELEAAECNG